MKVAISLVSIVAVLVAAPAASAQGSAGAGFGYNAGTHAVLLNVKNNSSGTDLDSVTFKLPLGTTLNGTPSGGGSCEQLNSSEGKCVYTTAVAPGKQAFLLINTEGVEPASVEVTAHFNDGSTVAVTASKCGAVGISPTNLPNGTQGENYLQSLTPTGGTGPYSFSHQGALPPGVELTPAGTLTGVPAEGGAFSFQAVASDSNGCTGIRPYTVTILDAPPPKEASRSADMAGVFVGPGLFRGKEEEEFAENLASLVVPVPSTDPQQSSGFVGYSTWYEGEFAQVGFAARNKGPDSAAYAADVSVSQGKLAYAGYSTPYVEAGSSFNSVFRAAPPPLLHMGSQVDLVYNLPKLPAGSITVKGTVTDVLPNDPNLANNTAGPTTFTVLPRTRFSKLSLASSGAGADLTGQAAPAGKGAKRPTGKVGPVEVALLRRDKKGRCSWVTGAGKLLPKPSEARCGKPVFLPANGTANWRRHFAKAPPKGPYEALIRPRATKSSAMREFGAKLHNLFKVTAR